MVAHTAAQPAWNTFVESRFAEYPIYIQRNTARKSPVTNFERQPGIELHVTHRGRGAFYLEGEVYLQEERQIMLLSGACAHQVFADTRTHYERSVVCFDHRTVSWLVEDGRMEGLLERLPKGTEGYPLCLPPDEWREADALIGRLAREFTHRQWGWESSVLGSLLQLLVLTLRRKADAPTVTSNSLAQRCITLINANLDQPLSLSVLAEMLCISPKHLSRVFNGSIGMRLGEYIKHQRVTLAQRMLREKPDLPVSAVSDLCGFKSPAHFSTSFAHVTGVTPTSYRSLQRR